MTRNVAKASSERVSSGPFPIDWGELGPLRIRAKAVADGVYAGSHPSVRRGAGIEFGGYRAYTPGDDMRQLDRRALLRHDRLLLRQFETETDRALWLLVDGSASMSFRGPKSPGDKLAYAALIAAALARIATASGDPVGLAWIGGDGVRPLPASSGREAFERVTSALEGARAFGDALAESRMLDDALALVARRARRGAVVVLLSDLLDLPERALSSFAALGSEGRVLVALRVLDPTEAELDFSGTVRLRALEGGAVVEADADAVRATYKERLAATLGTWTDTLTARGGRVVSALTRDNATGVVRALVQAAAEARR
jgi:uncharacterized protein (DUF58 family)